MKNVIRTCALGVGLTAMFAASALAGSLESRMVSIPFQFQVGKTTMAAGDYRLQATSASGIAYLVNVKTGQQVQMLLSPGAKADGKLKLVFDTMNGGHTLKGIS